jgi:hypothetical protein
MRECDSPTNQLTIVKCKERPYDFLEIWQLQALTGWKDGQSIVIGFEWPRNTLVSRACHDAGCFLFYSYGIIDDNLS